MYKDGLVDRFDKVKANVYRYLRHFVVNIRCMLRLYMFRIRYIRIRKLVLNSEPEEIIDDWWI